MNEYCKYCKHAKENDEGLFQGMTFIGFMFIPLPNPNYHDDHKCDNYDSIFYGDGVNDYDSCTNFEPDGS